MPSSHSYPGLGSPPFPSSPSSRGQAARALHQEQEEQMFNSRANEEEDGSSNAALLPSNSNKDNDKTLKNALRQFSAAFFLLGLLNNVLYVIILSATLDLVPPNVPKGVILFVNIAPALLVKIGWPYFVPGRVRYGRRVTGCSLTSFLGILLVATSTTLQPRLFGIALASFSSGLGEMTFLQRTTCYHNDEYAKLAVGWFSSGTGAAGLVGAALWWELRALGVKTGISISSVLPVCMGVIYFLLLPKSTVFQNQTSSYMPISTDEESEPATTTTTQDINAQSFIRRTNIQDADDEDTVDDTAIVMIPPSPGTGFIDNIPVLKPTLSTSEKLDLAKPLFLPFMIPLFVVYFAEYTVNTGVSPTLLYPVPDPQDHPLLASIIKKLSDYYPLWQLVYQTFVFFSRSSSVIFHVPPLPLRLIPLPSILQFIVLLVGILESTQQIFTSIFGPAYAIGACAVLIALEGLFGGTAYVNAYLRVGLIEDKDDTLDKGAILARREFRMACVGFADTLGILAASLVSSWLEPTLCSIQVDSGRSLCREVK